MSTKPKKPEAHFIHRNVCEQRVHTSRTIDTQLITSIDPVNIWIKRMKWETFCAITSPTYPDLVVEFYSKMFIDEGKEDVVYTVVKKKMIVITVQMLHEILNVPIAGSKLGKVNDEKKVEGFDWEKYLIPDGQVTELYADCMQQDARMAHYLLINYVMPKTECVNSVSAKERCVIWHMLENKPLNLPVLLISHMKETNGTLPYGSLITKILQREGVLIDEREYQKQGIPITWVTLEKLPHSQEPNEKKHKRKAVEVEMEFEPVADAITAIKSESTHTLPRPPISTIHTHTSTLPSSSIQANTASAMVGATQDIDEQSNILQELSYIKAELHHVNILLQKHNLTEHTQELAFLQRSSYEQLYKLQRISEGAPTLPAIAAAATDEAKATLEELHWHVEDIMHQQNLNNDLCAKCGSQLGDLTKMVCDIRRDQKKTHAAITRIDDTLLSYGIQIQEVGKASESADQLNIENQSIQFQVDIFQRLEKLQNGLKKIEETKLCFGSQLLDLVRLGDEIDQKITSILARQLQSEEFQRNTLHVQSAGMSTGLLWQNKIVLIAIGELLRDSPPSEEREVKLRKCIDEFKSRLGVLQKLEPPKDELPMINRQIAEFVKPEILEIDIVGMLEANQREDKHTQDAADLDMKKKAKEAQST